MAVACDCPLSASASPEKLRKFKNKINNNYLKEIDLRDMMNILLMLVVIDRLSNVCKKKVTMRAFTCSASVVAVDAGVYQIGDIVAR